MKEYIEREALIRRITEIHCAECDSYHGVRCRACWVDDTLDYIDSEPVADVAPVRHGRWVQVIVHVEFEDGFVDRVEEYCSACHEPNERRCTYFCHNCGAKMDLPDECKQDGER